MCGDDKITQGQLTHRRKIINKLEILVQKSERTKEDLKEKDKCKEINQSLLNKYGARKYIEVACLRLGTSDGLLYFFYGATVRIGSRPPHYRGFTIILRHTTLGRTPLDE